MAVTVEASGTQAATINTEHSLHSNAGAKVFVLIVDSKAMVNGDVLELRVKLKTLTGSTIAQAYSASFSHVQADKVKLSIPIPSPGFSAEFTLKQVSGTGRSYEWSVISL